jgi:hypothetical protein
MVAFTGVKVFSATKAWEREQISDRINEWLENNHGVEIVDKVVTQSSDSEFHCLTITLFSTRVQAITTRPSRPRCEALHGASRLIGFTAHRA